MCVCSVGKLCLTLWPRGLRPARLLYPRDSPCKNTSVDCHFLLQGIFLIQGLNLHLLHWQIDALPLSHFGSPLIIICYDYMSPLFTLFSMGGSSGHIWTSPGVWGWMHTRWLEAMILVGLSYSSRASVGMNPLTIFRSTRFPLLQQATFFLSHNVVGFQDQKKKKKRPGQTTGVSYYYHIITQSKCLRSWQMGNSS